MGELSRRPHMEARDYISELEAKLTAAEQERDEARNMNLGLGELARRYREALGEIERVLAQSGDSAISRVGHAAVTARQALSDPNEESSE